jgi:hypothetical protein
LKIKTLLKYCLSSFNLEKRGINSGDKMLVNTPINGKPSKAILAKSFSISKNQIISDYYLP